MVWMLWTMVGSPSHWLHSLFLPSSIVLVIGLFIVRNERHWSRPARLLRELLPQIRSGAAPIEELAAIDGGLVPLVSEIQKILHDLRRQKTAVAELNDEIRQRVATRTNALERQIGSLRQQASRDGLSGLYNRRMFDVYLPKIIERCAADKMDLSLLMIDVDNFKVLNDTLGHAAGDELLRNISDIIRSGIRDQDAPFRVGGDEFVIILPGAGPGASEGLAKRLGGLVDALAKPMRLARLPRLSIGIGSLSEIAAGADAAQLVQLADRRLYETKGSRRSKSAPPPLPLAKSA
jgi:diguanylate cyclase (GGDEF)-like protein